MLKIVGYVVAGSIVILFAAFAGDSEHARRAQAPPEQVQAETQAPSVKDKKELAGDTFSDAQWESLKAQAVRSHEAAERAHAAVDIAHGELELAQSRLRLLEGR
jgi:hypothetical protein